MLQIFKGVSSKVKLCNDSTANVGQGLWKKAQQGPRYAPGLQDTPRKAGDEPQEIGWAVWVYEKVEWDYNQGENWRDCSNWQDSEELGSLLELKMLGSYEFTQIQLMICMNNLSVLVKCDNDYYIVMQWCDTKFRVISNCLSFTRP